jgi:hypothetical protein
MIPVYLGYAWYNYRSHLGRLDCRCTMDEVLPPQKIHRVGQETRREFHEARSKNSIPLRYQGVKLLGFYQGLINDDRVRLDTDETKKLVRV